MDQQAPSKTEFAASPGYRHSQGLEAKTLRNDVVAVEYERVERRRLPKASVNHVILGGSQRKESNATHRRLAKSGKKHAKRIELKWRMNATLEAMTRAQFQNWFVDFDTVRSNIDRAGKKSSALSTKAMAKEDALFPDSFQDTDLGHTPKGWEVCSLDRGGHYMNGLALKKYPLGDGPTLPVIKIAQLRKGDAIGADRCNTNLPPEYIVQDGDVLFSWSGSIEVELWCGGPGALNQHLFKVTSPEFPKWFYYLLTLYHLDEFRLIAADKATTMAHIQRGHLTAAKVLIPPRPLLDAMTAIMSYLIDQIIANRTQSRTLATLRDTLLPKLLSGELNTTNFL